MSLAGKTIKSLIRELQRRGQALDAISSIMKYFLLIFRNK